MSTQLKSGNSVTVTAHPNIALVKYWGKRDEDLILPLNSSISMTLSDLKTITKLEKAEKDFLVLNDKMLDPDSESYKKYFKSFLDKIREKFPEITNVKVTSKNNFPTAAGIASSASGFAALALALNHLFKLELNTIELSKLARLGSGSATRSLLGGFNFWLMGKEPDGSDSQIKQIANQSHWPELRLAVAITDLSKKTTPSRAGMTATVQTSPDYQTLWLDTVEKDLRAMESAILTRDFKLLGEIAESSATKMHQTMRSTIPPIDYFNSGTKKIIKAIQQNREQGHFSSYFTVDAGPQVKIIYLEEDYDKVVQMLNKIEEVKQVFHCQAGPDPLIVKEDDSD